MNLPQFLWPSNRTELPLALLWYSVVRDLQNAVKIVVFLHPADSGTALIDVGLCMVMGRSMNLVMRAVAGDLFLST